MSRFQREISGELGEYWRKEAQKELDELKVELANGKITIDDEGVARNKVGRVVMSDMLEKLLLISDKINEEVLKLLAKKK